MSYSATPLTDSQWDHHNQSSTTPCRSFFCSKCSARCEICTHCDRGQIYCPACAPFAAAARKKKANKQYRVTFNGKRVRAALERARRVRLKNPPSVDDRGSLPAAASANFSAPQITSAEKKENGDAAGREYKERAYSNIEEQTDKTGLRCSFCRKVAPPFRRQGDIPWRRQKKNWKIYKRKCNASHAREGPP